MLRGVVNCFLKVMRDTCKWNFFPALMQSDVGRKLVAILTEELAADLARELARELVRNRHGSWRRSWRGSWREVGNEGKLLKLAGS